MNPGVSLSRRRLSGVFAGWLRGDFTLGRFSICTDLSGFRGGIDTPSKIAINYNYIEQRQDCRHKTASEGGEGRGYDNPADIVHLLAGARAGRDFGEGSGNHQDRRAERSVWRVRQLSGH